MAYFLVKSKKGKIWRIVSIKRSSVSMEVILSLIEIILVSVIESDKRNLSVLDPTNSDILSA